jgi:hypothetical protein
VKLASVELAFIITRPAGRVTIPNRNDNLSTTIFTTICHLNINQWISQLSVVLLVSRLLAKFIVLSVKRSCIPDNSIHGNLPKTGRSRDQRGWPPLSGRGANLGQY